MEAVSANIPPKLTSEHLGTICSTLEATLAISSDVRCPAEQTLKQCELVPGFSTVLLEIVSKREEYDLKMRLVSVICLKNVFKRVWKPRGRTQSSARSEKAAVFVIPPEEKQFVREYMLHHMDEIEKPIATQLAVLTAQISRVDWPQDWPNLFPSLLSYLQSGNALQLSRALFTLKRVLKELATRRLMVHKKAFSTMAKEIFPLIYSLWSQQLQRTLAALDGLLSSKQTHSAEDNVFTPEELREAFTQFELVKHASKILYHLIVNTFPELSLDECFREIHCSLERMLARRGAVIGLICGNYGIEFMDVFDNCIVTMSKIITRTQNQHAIPFRTFLVPFLSLFNNQISSDADFHYEKYTTITKFLIQAVLFISNVVTCRVYEFDSSAHSHTGQVTKLITSSGDCIVSEEVLRQVSNDVNSFFSLQVQQKLIECVLTRWMVLLPEELKHWLEDPEEFLLSLEKNTISDCLRSCSENLFLSLLQKNRDGLAPYFIHVVQSMENQFMDKLHNQMGISYAEVLRLDGVYLGMGIASYDLHESFDFEPWFRQTLITCLQKLASHGAFETVENVVHGPIIIRRRILWLISCWIAQISPELRSSLYENLYLVMNENTSNEHVCDLAVKLSALETLKSLIDDWSFDKTQFKPYLQDGIRCLFGIFYQSDQTETRIKVLALIRSIVVTCGDFIAPHLETIVTPLPAIWDAAADENLLRGHILSILTKVVNSVGPRSVDLQPLILPVVKYSTDIDQPDSVYLIEHGLELWQEIVFVSTQYDIQLHELFRNLPKILLRDFEHIKLGISLIESYVLAGRETFWADYAPSVAQIFDQTVGNIKPSASSQVIRTLETIVRVHAPHGISCCNGVLGSLVDACVLSAKRDPQKEPDFVIMGYLTILARVFLHAPGTFSSLIQFKASNHSTTTTAMLSMLLGLYLKLFYSIVSNAIGPWRKKVWACCLVGFLDFHEAEILDHVGQILDACVDVMEAIQKDEEADGGLKSLRSSEQAFNTEKVRKQHLQENDEIFKVNLMKYTQEKLNTLAAAIGPEQFQRVISMVDSSVIQKFQ